MGGEGLSQEEEKELKKKGKKCGCQHQPNLLLFPPANWREEERDYPKKKEKKKILKIERKRRKVKLPTPAQPSLVLPPICRWGGGEGLSQEEKRKYLEEKEETDQSIKGERGEKCCSHLQIGEEKESGLSQEKIDQQKERKLKKKESPNFK